MASKVGQAISKDNFDAARARLLGTGALKASAMNSSPTPRKPATKLRLTLPKSLLLYRFRFEDLPASDEALRAALAKQQILLGQVIPATREVLDRYEYVLTQALEGKVTVQGKLNYDLAGEPTILFRPAGERPRISEVHLNGNESVPAAQLLNKFADVAVGSEFTEPAVRRLLEASLRPLYEARGRLRVAFPKIVAEPSKHPDVVGVSVTVTVEEGPPYMLGAVRFTGAAAKQAKELDDGHGKDERPQISTRSKTGLDRNSSASI